MAHEGLRDRNLAKMRIALRTRGYGDLRTQIFKKLDDANRPNLPPSGLGPSLNNPAVCSH